MPSLLPPNSFYVVSYPRSGNTWLINCLTMLFGGVRGEAYTPFKLYTELHGDPANGFHFWCEPRQQPDQPVCIKSHDDLGNFRRRHPPAPVVYLARDARDSLLSYYFFQQAYTRGEELATRRVEGTDVLISRGSSDPVFNAADFSAFLLREAPQWVAHVKSARDDGQLLFLTYESLTAQFEATLGQVAAHLGLTRVHSCEEVRQVYHTGFSAVFTGNNRDFFRRGQVGDWRNWYSSAHALLLDELIGADLKSLGFESDARWAANFQPARPASSA